MNFVVIQWPFVQQLMEIEGFYNNSYPILDEKGLEDFGSSAYFVKTNWLGQVNLRTTNVI